MKATARTRLAEARRVAAGLLRPLQRLRDDAAAALVRVKPTVVPLIERAASQLSRPGPSLSGGSVRVTLEQYFRRTIQISSATFGSSAQEQGRVMQSQPELEPGVRHLTLGVEQRLLQLRRLQHFESQADPIEAVHQLRVASRRLRAFVDMFGPMVDPKLGESLAPRLRRITRAMRDVRDSDVLASNLETRLAKATSEPERIALDHLLDRIKRRRRKCAVRAQRRLNAVEFGEVARLLRCMLDEIAVRSQAPSSSYELLAHVAYQPIIDVVREASARVEPTSTPQQLHQLRLTLKQLRYASELIQPALGERFVEIQDRAKRLQAVLGDHQDHAELEKLLTRRHEKAVQRRRETLAAGLSGILEQVRGERARYQRVCLDECSKLCGQRLFSQVEV